MALAGLLTTTIALVAVVVGATLRRMSGRHVFHEWGGWSQPAPGTFPWSKPVQERHCITCNKVKRRKVKAR